MTPILCLENQISLIFN